MIATKSIRRVSLPMIGGCLGVACLVVALLCEHDLPMRFGGGDVFWFGMRQLFNGAGISALVLSIIAALRSED